MTNHMRDVAQPTGEKQALLAYLDTMLSNSTEPTPLSGLICKHGVAIESCVSRDCDNPFAYETAIRLARDFIAAQPPAAPCNAAGNRYPSDEDAEWAINGAHEFAEGLRSKTAPVETEEPAGWQYRFKDRGQWTQWVNVPGEIEVFRNIQADSLATGNVEQRPIYTHPLPRSSHVPLAPPATRI